MTHLKRIVAIAAAIMLTFGFSAGHVANAQEADTDAELAKATGTNCTLDLLPAAAINYGVFTYDRLAGLYKNASGFSNTSVTFGLAMYTYEPNIKCSVTAYGTDLTRTGPGAATGTIPFTHVFFRNGVSGSLFAGLPAFYTPIAIAPAFANWSSSAISQTTVIDGTTTITAGTGAAAIETELRLLTPDHSLPPGLYDGALTFTSSQVTP